MEFVLGAINDGAIEEVNALSFATYNSIPFLLAVATPTSPNRTVKQSAFNHALSTESIGSVVFYSGDDKVLEVFRRRFSDSEFELIPDLEYNFKQLSAENHSMHSTRAVSSSLAHKPAKQMSLLPITNELEDVFFAIHSTMRDTDGLHADTALEELCKLLYLKSFMEEQKELLPLPSIQSSQFGSGEEFAACLRSIYREACEYDLRVFRLRIPEYERSRGVFNSPFHLSNAALIKSYKAIEDYNLTETDTDLKGRAFQRVLTKSIRAGMGQYFTPAPVCNLMVNILEPKTSDLIIDPFCGSGHFLSLCLAKVRSTCDLESKEYHEFAFGKLHGIEKSDRMTRIAMTDMRLNGDGHSNIRCTDALLDFRNYPDLKPGSFDIVVTNPPFGSTLGAEALEALASFQLATNRRKVPLDVLGLERAIELLRPGGKLAIVLPESIFNANSCRYVRDWILEKLDVRIIIDLPNETFAPFGANVRSGILFGRKWNEGEAQDLKKDICMIRLDNLGYDASGRPINGAEQDEAEAIVTEFLRRNGW